MEDIIGPYLWPFEEEEQVFGNGGEEEEKESCVRQPSQMSDDGDSCSTTPLKGGQ